MQRLPHKDQNNNRNCKKQLKSCIGHCHAKVVRGKVATRLSPARILTGG